MKHMHMQKNLMKKIALWGGGILAIGAIFGFLWWSYTQSNPESENITPISQSDWIRGNQNAPVRIIVYSDFQCPACKYYASFMDRIVSDEGTNVALVYRNFPLYQNHPYTLAASFAAEAAGKQGKFWDMHAMLFTKQDEWLQSKSIDEAQGFFRSYAKTLKLDVNQFSQDMASRDIMDKVFAQYQMGIHDHVQWTPTIFINSTRIQNPQSYDAFKALVDQALHAR